MKTLNIIMKLAKAARILSKIVFVCCLVGFIFCCVAIPTMLLIPETLVINGVTVHALIEARAELSMATLYTATLFGIVACLAQCIVSRMAVRTFDSVLDAGTPFNFESASSFMRLGITKAAVSIGTAIATGIIYAIMAHYYGDIKDMDINNLSSVGMGIAFILTSLLCRYGAEVKEGGKNA